MLPLSELRGITAKLLEIVQKLRTKTEEVDHAALRHLAGDLELEKLGPEHILAIRTLQRELGGQYQQLGAWLRRYDRPIPGHRVPHSNRFRDIPNLSTLLRNPSEWSALTAVKGMEGNYPQNGAAPLALRIMKAEFIADAVGPGRKLQIRGNFVKPETGDVAGRMSLRWHKANDTISVYQDLLINPQVCPGGRPDVLNELHEACMGYYLDDIYGGHEAIPVQEISVITKIPRQLTEQLVDFYELNPTRTNTTVLKNALQAAVAEAGGPPISANFNPIRQALQHVREGNVPHIRKLVGVAPDQQALPPDARNLVRKHLDGWEGALKLR